MGNLLGERSLGLRRPRALDGAHRPEDDRQSSTIARMSFWETISRSSPSTLNSVPAYFAYRTLSPTLTSIASRVPSSRILPGPADRIVPSWGFSLAVSGRTIPLFVISSRAVGWITTRSPSGRSFVAEAVAVAVANVHSSWDGGGRP